MINTYYQNRYNVAVRPAGATPKTGSAGPAEQANAARSAQQAGAAAPGLSTEEQQMIDRYFPASDKMSTRLYGPGQSARTLNPGRLGGLLDIQG